MKDLHTLSLDLNVSVALLEQLAKLNESQLTPEFFEQLREAAVELQPNRNQSAILAQCNELLKPLGLEIDLDDTDDGLVPLIFERKS